MRASSDFEPYPDPELVLNWLEQRFGLGSELFQDHQLWHRSGSAPIWIAQAGVQPPLGLAINALGIMLSRKPPPRAKPSSIFLMRFGAQATRNVYCLNEAESARFLRREAQHIEAPEGARGYCIVKAVRGDVLGCGRLDKGILYSEIPKSWIYEIQGSSKV